MASCKYFLILVLALLGMILSLPSLSHAQLSASFYDSTCSSALDIVKSNVRAAINRDKRIGAKMVRLFFHDCFVVSTNMSNKSGLERNILVRLPIREFTLKFAAANMGVVAANICSYESAAICLQGCDAGVLLDDNLPTIDSEKNSISNKNSLGGFELIDKIKDAIDKACPGPVVSCSDILAVATRDSVVELGGPSWSVPLGRRDARTASRNEADNLPSPFSDLKDLLKNFSDKGFTAKEMVALSGAHSIGLARCSLFRTHLYNGTNVETLVSTDRKTKCPSNGGDDNLASMDHQSPNRFGNNYFQSLTVRRGLLHSDQELFNGGSTDDIVKTYSQDSQAFYTDFANAMIKLGNLNALTGNKGEIRKDCKKIN